MPQSLPLGQRVWLIPAAIAAIALGACAAGVAPCVVAKPLGLAATAAAALLLAIEDDPATSVG
jgi:hypothetical protein